MLATCSRSVAVDRVCIELATSISVTSINCLPLWLISEHTTCTTTAVRKVYVTSVRKWLKLAIMTTLCNLFCLFGTALHLWNKLPPILFVFLISLVHHHHPALHHHHALILDRLLTFLMTFSTLVLKSFYSQALPVHSHLCFAKAHLLEFDRSVFCSHWRW